MQSCQLCLSLDTVRAASEIRISENWRPQDSSVHPTIHLPIYPPLCWFSCLKSWVSVKVWCSLQTPGGSVSSPSTRAAALLLCGSWNEKESFKVKNRTSQISAKPGEYLKMKLWFLILTLQRVVEVKSCLLPVRSLKRFLAWARSSESKYQTVMAYLKPIQQWVQWLHLFNKLQI